MKHYRMILLPAAILFLLALTACANKNEKPKIGLCLRQGVETDAGYQAVKGNLTGAGYQVFTVYAKNDQSKQNKQISSLIEENYDLLIVEPVQTAVSGWIVEQAKVAAVPVLFINREPAQEVLEAWENVCYVGSDAAQPGLLQGQIILQTPDSGDINGDGIVTCVVIGGPADHLDAQLRTESCCKALTDQGIEVVRLDAGSGDWTQASGKRVCEYALSQYGKDIEVVFCNNDAMALGAQAAIQDAGRTVGNDIYLVGIGGEKTVMDLVQNGSMTGTVAADSQELAKYTLAAVKALLDGKAVEKRQCIDYVKVFRKNAKEELAIEG